MIVEITSLAPVLAFRNPAIPPHSAPASVPSTIASRMWRKPGSPSNDEPTQTPIYSPMKYWPWPPMLNRPARNAYATAMPVRISGVVMISVCCRFSAASVRSSDEIHGKNQLRPEPSKIAL